MSTPLVVGIAGGTASGKTTVARKILEALAGYRVAFIDQDAYYKEMADLSPEERREVNFDHPDAFDTDLMVRHLSELKAGKAIDKPVYDFVAYARRPETKTISPADVVIVEGILVLHLQPVRELCEMKIFVDAEDDVRIIRRLVRDIKDRGRDFDRVVEQYFRSVRPMHMGFVEPSKRHADIIVPQGGDNEVAIRMLVDAIRARLGQRSPPRS
jgi:uridine kinase